MTEPETPAAPARGRGSGKADAHRLTILGVLGELLVTAGVLVLLFLGWQVWWNSWMLSGQQSSAAEQQSQKWIDEARAQASASPTPASSPAASATPVPTDDPAPDYGAAPATAKVGFAEALGVLYIPRFGADFKRVIKESVDLEHVLNSYTAGVGHYTDSEMPGENGNFAIAGHDTGWGNVFIDVGKLRVGDDIYVQTKDGYYTYTFRNFEFVRPSAVSVIAAVPRHPEAKPKGQYLTITTCNPHYRGGERLIAYATFTSWQPLTAGAPEAIAASVKKG